MYLDRFINTQLFVEYMEDINLVFLQGDSGFVDVSDDTSVPDTLTELVLPTVVGTSSKGKSILKYSSLLLFISLISIFF